MTARQAGDSVARVRFHRAPIGVILPIGVVLLLSISPIAGARPSNGAFPRATWNYTLYKSVSPCAAITIPSSYWTHITGDGLIYDLGVAHTCGPRKLVGTPDSFAGAATALTVNVPVSLASGRGGVNVSWNLHVMALTFADVFGPTACLNKGYSNHSYSGTPSYTISIINWNCNASATIDVSGGATLIDLTTSTLYLAANHWAGVFNASGMYNNSATAWVNYSGVSNRSVNSSYSYGSAGSYGSNGSASGTYLPTWFFNETFRSTDKYEIQTEITFYSSVNLLGYASAHGRALLNAERGPYHADLLPLSTW
jgi:hypothetical protein